MKVLSPELANSLLRVFDTPQTVDVISEYADYEISRAQAVLASTSDLVAMGRCQGVIIAMENLKRIRTSAAAVVELQMSQANGPTSQTRN